MVEKVDRLYRNLPDYGTIDNIKGLEIHFVKENEISGFIDIGKMGPADRWQDIAIAIRSLKHNFDGKYTDGKKIFNFKPQTFLDALGVDFDNQKYKYYFLLDELF